MSCLEYSGSQMVLPIIEEYEVFLYIYSTLNIVQAFLKVQASLYIHG